ncbi:MAG: hypothetical protein LCH88_22260 [Proteobacteria bacterium]|nr:hypothetical protein [Pseudomonadota bacterium]
MSMSRRFAVAGALALVVGGAMSGAALARGGGGGGGGGGGDVPGLVDAPNIQIPPRRGRATPQGGTATTTNCRYEVYNVTRECERVRRYW